MADQLGRRQRGANGQRQPGERRAHVRGGWELHDRATASDEDSTYAATSTVAVQASTPVLPVADAGGPYTVAQGGNVALSGAASTGSTLMYAWDLDGDGIYGEAGAGALRGNETGVTPSFSAAGLDNGAYSVAPAHHRRPWSHQLGLRGGDGHQRRADDHRQPSGQRGRRIAVPDYADGV